MLLKMTRCDVGKKTGDHTLGHVMDPEVRVVTLMKKVDGWDRVRLRSPVLAGMPERMLPLTEESARTIVATLLEERRVNFGVRISSSLNMSREGGKVQPTFKYAVLRASNADRVGDVS